MKWSYPLYKYIITPVRRSLRTKLFLLISVVAILPLILATGISAVNSRNAMEQEIISQNNNKIAWVGETLAADVDRIDESLTAFYFDNNLKFYISKLDRDNSMFTESVSFFKTKLRSHLLANISDVDTVAFYSFEHQSYFRISLETDFVSGNITENQVRSNPLFLHPGELTYIMSENGSKKVVDGPYITKMFMRFEDQKPIGALTVKLNWNLFDQAYRLLDFEKGNTIFFTDGSGNLIYDKIVDGLDSDYIGKIYANVSSVDKDSSGFILMNEDYVFYSWISKNLLLIKTIPANIADALYKKTLFTQLGIIILTGFVILTATFWLGNRLTTPMKRLTKRMQDVDAILDTDKEIVSRVRTNDEIKVLEQSFLFMVQKIRSLIDSEYKQKIEMQSAQLMALQAQINPHFMYNTLQMIGGMAVEKGSMEIYETIRAFSNMMRYNMQLTEDMVSIEEEVTNLDNYLQIQNRRFEGKLSSNIEIDKNLRKYLVPKLSIQPLVENCFKHGFSRSSEKWKIEIRVYDQDGDIAIEIIDNGEGIDLVELEEIREALKKDAAIVFTGKEHLGLKNIDSRLKLFFGKEYGLTIDSSADEGTTIKMLFGRREA